MSLRVREAPCSIFDHLVFPVIAFILIFLLKLQSSHGTALAVMAINLVRPLLHFFLGLAFKKRMFTPNPARPHSLSQWCQWILVFVALGHSVFQSGFEETFSRETMEEVFYLVLVGFAFDGLKIFKAPDKQEILERAVEENPALIDIGAASSDSFWYGYLADVLPQTDILPGFQNRQIMRGDNNLGTVESPMTAPLHLIPKLFILVSSDVPEGKIEDNISQFQQACPTLTPTGIVIAPLSVDRAGVKGRELGKHSLYTITCGEVKHLFAMEWASPCRTMQKMGMPEEDLNIQIEALYERLTKVCKGRPGGEHVEFILGRTSKEALKALHVRISSEMSTVSSN